MNLELLNQLLPEDEFHGREALARHVQRLGIKPAGVSLKPAQLDQWWESFEERLNPAGSAHEAATEVSLEGCWNLWQKHFEEVADGKEEDEYSIELLQALAMKTGDDLERVEFGLDRLPHKWNVSDASQCFTRALRQHVAAECEFPENGEDVPQWLIGPAMLRLGLGFLAEEFLLKINFPEAETGWLATWIGALSEENKRPCDWALISFHHNAAERGKPDCSKEWSVSREYGALRIDRELFFPSSKHNAEARFRDTAKRHIETLFSLEASREKPPILFNDRRVPSSSPGSPLRDIETNWDKKRRFGLFPKGDSEQSVWPLIRNTSSLDAAMEEALGRI